MDTSTHKKSKRTHISESSWTLSNTSWRRAHWKWPFQQPARHSDNRYLFTPVAAYHDRLRVCKKIKMKNRQSHKQLSVCHPLGVCWQALASLLRLWQCIVSAQQATGTHPAAPFSSVRQCDSVTVIICLAFTHCLPPGWKQWCALYDVRQEIAAKEFSLTQNAFTL